MPFKVLSFDIICEWHFYFQVYLTMQFYVSSSNPSEDRENLELISVGFELCLYASEELLVLSVTVLE